jgi:Ca2+/Na+ antiporter
VGQFTKNDKTVLIIFVVLHIIVSSVARVAGVKMATSISLIVFSFFYILYILLSHRTYRNKTMSNSQLINESNKIVKLKTNNNFTLYILLTIFIGLGFYWFEIRPANFRSYCNWSIKYGPDYKEGLNLQNFELRYRSCLRSKGLEE